MCTIFVLNISTHSKISQLDLPHIYVSTPVWVHGMHGMAVCEPSHPPAVLWQLGLGTVLVMVFADPMVGVIDEVLCCMLFVMGKHACHTS